MRPRARVAPGHRRRRPERLRDARAQATLCPRCQLRSGLPDQHSETTDTALRPVPSPASILSPSFMTSRRPQLPTAPQQPRRPHLPPLAGGQKRSAGPAPGVETLRRQHNRTGPKRQTCIPLPLPRRFHRLLHMGRALVAGSWRNNRPRPSAGPPDSGLPRQARLPRRPPSELLNSRHLSYITT